MSAKALLSQAQDQPRQLDEHKPTPVPDPWAWIWNSQVLGNVQLIGSDVLMACARSSG
jgi:hypothetical protein